jgi:anti-sigma regulatory factor (Ser/Thr protein kinase)
MLNSLNTSVEPPDQSRVAVGVSDGTRRDIEFASHPANLCLVRDFVRQFLRACAFSELEKDLMVLGLDEACTNVIRYAYNHEPDQLICLECQMLPNGVQFRLRDFGSQADPTKLQGRPLDLVQPGGLGLHLIRKAFSQVDYVLKKEGTELILIKYTQPQPARAAGRQ